MQKINFSVDQKVLDLGLKIQAIKITGIINSKSNPTFLEYQNEELEKLKEYWKGNQIENDQILKGFRDLHTKVGRSNKKFVSSPESLIWLLKERGRFPQINTLVDIYNLISIKYKLALGAHDIRKVIDNIALKITDGSEKFISLETHQPENIFPGEYAYVDSGNNVICRLEVIQCEKTKITPESKDVFFIIQGNSNTTIDHIDTATKELIELVNRFCRGEVTYLNKLS